MSATIYTDVDPDTNVTNQAQIHVHWTEPTNTSGSPVAQYRIYLVKGNERLGKYIRAHQVGADVRETSFTMLENDTEYRIEIDACNAKKWCGRDHDREVKTKVTPSSWSGKFPISRLDSRVRGVADMRMTWDTPTMPAGSNYTLQGYETRVWNQKYSPWSWGSLPVGD